METTKTKLLFSLYNSVNNLRNRFSNKSSSNLYTKLNMKLESSQYSIEDKDADGNANSEKVTVNFESIGEGMTIWIDQNKNHLSLSVKQAKDLHDLLFQFITQ